MCSDLSESGEPKEEAGSSYPETVLVFSGDAERMIDLREPVGVAAKAALRALGFGEPFAVLTSFNPRGENLDAGENARRFDELESELGVSGVAYTILDACSPDMSHCERSVAVKTDVVSARRIAARWEQLAIFWWDGREFWIYGAESSVEPVRLPVVFQ